ncbi:cupin domain protein [Tritrichomonas foetus]|uniref:Cupin domain protein n=2 Tax=Tritrichomonas foetus TaxID=1144522 RepID=A0A1J4KXD9_9EUKA|nr:cupin domain protein [Tritrichomonas foetus]|eukprot:OHT14221.1 cupin domain protein [Tritrichomonas foetus]
MSIKVISGNDKYTAINVGKMNEINKHQLKDGTGKVLAEGKAFLGDALKMTGAQMSINSVPVGQAGPFFHLHKENEEIYFIVSGEGEYQVDDVIIPIHEGSFVRVGPGASHNLKNTGKVPLIFLCVQVRSNSLGDISHDYEITQTTPKFH